MVPPRPDAGPSGWFSGPTYDVVKCPRPQPFRFRPSTSLDARLNLVDEQPARAWLSDQQRLPISSRTSLVRS
jgi:hypothetical protein